MYFPMRRLIPLAAIVPFFPAAACGAGVDFRRDVRPILAAHCYDCHAEQKPKGGLKLTSRANATRGGKSETPAFIAGQSAASEMIVRVTSNDPDEQMPPRDDRLNAREVGTLKRWIDAGAPWPDDV